MALEEAYAAIGVKSVNSLRLHEMKMSVQLPQNVAENIGGFTGRAWLLPEFSEWWDRTDRLFLLIGGPGTGKSMNPRLAGRLRTASP
jgi:hypothetical protein